MDTKSIHFLLTIAASSVTLVTILSGFMISRILTIISENQERSIMIKNLNTKIGETEKRIDDIRLDVEKEKEGSKRYLEGLDLISALDKELEITKIDLKTHENIETDKNISLSVKGIWIFLFHTLSTIIFPIGLCLFYFNSPNIPYIFILLVGLLFILGIILVFIYFLYIFRLAKK